MEIHETLRQVRQNSGLTQQEVSRRSGIDDSTLSAIERGSQEPKLAQLSTLSEVYRLPLSILLGESPIPTHLVMWRKEPEGSKEIEAEFLELCQQFHQLEMWTDDLADYELPALDDRPYNQGYWYQEVSVLAEKTWKHLALGNHPGESLLFVLEEVFKVKIFHLDLGSSGSAACTYSPTFGPAVLMNSQACRWRRNHDLAHELFHLLTWERFGHQDGICEPSSDEEKLATCFAGNLLLPKAPFEGAIKKAEDAQGRLTFSKLDGIARQFDVSLSSLVWRMHYLYDQDIEATRRNQQKAQDYVNSAPRKDGPCPAKYPERYRALAIRALQEGQISVGKFAKFMSMSRREARQFVSGRDPEYAETAAT